jgi:hypothetical protein
MIQENGREGELCMADMIRTKALPEVKKGNKSILPTYALSDRHNTVELGGIV